MVQCSKDHFQVSTFVKRRSGISDTAERVQFLMGDLEATTGFHATHNNPQENLHHCLYHRINFGYDITTCSAAPITLCSVISRLLVPSADWLRLSNSSVTIDCYCTHTFQYIQFKQPSEGTLGSVGCPVCIFSPYWNKKVTD